jgi:hypothetical protein
MAKLEIIQMLPIKQNPSLNFTLVPHQRAFEIQNIKYKKYEIK